MRQLQIETYPKIREGSNKKTAEGIVRTWKVCNSKLICWI